VLDDPENKERKLFVKAKNNLAPDKKALAYGMGVKIVGYDAKLGVDIEAPFIVWHSQHVEITANEAMQAVGGKTAMREAKEFLRERLGAGPVNSDDIAEEAEQEGIAKATLRRAKKELGIKSRKQRGRHQPCGVRSLPRGLKKTCGLVGCRIGHPRRTASAVPLPPIQGGNNTLRGRQKTNKHNAFSRWRGIVSNA
jgi:hypothetical protein